MWEIEEEMNGDSRSTWPNAELHKEIAELQSQLAIAKAELENIKFLAEQAEICHQAELAEARNSTPSWIQDHTIEIAKLKAELAEARHVESEKLCRGLVLKLAKTQEQRDKFRVDLAEAQRENAGCWCKLTGQKMLKERDELRMELLGWKSVASSPREVEVKTNELQELRTQLTESRSKHLHDVLAEQMLNQELRARLDAAQNDGKRLDWLEKLLLSDGVICADNFANRGSEFFLSDSNEIKQEKWRVSDEPTIREAIDAAMSAEATEQAAPSTPQETRTPGA